MSDLQLRARTVSEIVDASFDLYRRNAARYLAVATLGAIPVLLLQIAFPDTLPSTDPAEVLSGSLARLVKFVATMAISVINTAMIIRLGAWDYLGEEVDAARAVREVLARVPALLGALVLKFVAYFFGLLLLLVGFFYFYARFFAVDAAIVLEDASISKAFGRSSALSEGRKRHVLNTVILIGLVYGIFSIGAGLLTGMTGSTALTLLTQSALSLVATPLFGLVFMLLYYDARIRGEGFDLQRMAAALDTSRPISA
jgi:hypothetical protein